MLSWRFARNGKQNILYWSWFAHNLYTIHSLVTLISWKISCDKRKKKLVFWSFSSIKKKKKGKQIATVCLLVLYTRLVIFISMPVYCNYNTCLSITMVFFSQTIYTSLGCDLVRDTIIFILTSSIISITVVFHNGQHTKCIAKTASLIFALAAKLQQERIECTYATHVIWCVREIFLTRARKE